MNKRFFLMAVIALMAAIAFGQDKLIVEGLRIAVNEGGDAHITVSLAEQPGYDVTVKVRSSNYSRIYVVDGAALFFTRDNWQTPQTAYLKCLDDNICNGDENIEISLFTTSKDNTYNELKVVNQIRVKDNDKAGVAITPNPLELNAQSRNGNVFVKLQSRPMEEVTVVLRSTEANVALTQTTLTFTPETWNVLQKVGVTASSRVTGTEPMSIMCMTRSESEAYNGVKASSDVRIQGVEVIIPEVTEAIDHSDDGEWEEEVMNQKLDKKKAKTDKAKAEKPEKKLTPEQLKKQKEKEKAAQKKAAEKKKAAAKKAAEKRKKEAAKKKAAAKKKK